MGEGGAQSGVGAGGAPDRTGQVVGGRFRLERLLRVGAVSTLYAATDIEADRPVMARVLDAAPPFGERFTQRALILGGLDAPRVARLYAAVRTDEGVPVLVEAPFEGESLAERMARRALTLNETLEVLDQVLEALAAVHPRGQVHGDLRPENLYIGLDPLGDLAVQIRGVGYAALFSEQAAPTLGGLLYGNPLFTAPEQWVNRPVDATTDLYALGALAYLMLTGDTFIRPGPPFAMCRQHFDAERPLITRTVLGEPVPVALARVIARAAAPDRGRRFPTAAALRSALETARPEIDVDLESAEPVHALDLGVDVEDQSFNLEASLLDDIAHEAGLDRPTRPEPPSLGGVDPDATATFLDLFGEGSSLMADVNASDRLRQDHRVHRGDAEAGATVEADLVAMVADMAAAEDGSMAGSWTTEAMQVRAAARSAPPVEADPLAHTAPQALMSTADRADARHGALLRSTGPAPLPPVGLRGTPLSAGASLAGRGSLSSNPSMRALPPGAIADSAAQMLSRGPAPIPPAPPPTVPRTSRRPPVDPSATAEAGDPDDGEIPDDTLDELPSGS